MATKRFTPQNNSESDPNRVRVAPRDLVNMLLVIEVLEVREEFKTKFAPQGKPAIRVNVASVSSGKVAPDQLFLNDALVDALRPYVGSTIAAKIEYKVSASTGYRYLTVVGVSDEEQSQADTFVDSHPDLFKVTPPAAEAPATAVGHW